MGQKKAYTILGFIVAFFLILLMFLINGFLGFLMLAAAIVAFCLLYKKYPWIVKQFAKKKPEQASAQPDVLSKENSFSSHIVLINNNSVRLEQIDVDAREFSIGRLPQCNYVIKGNPKVSREHAKIIYDELNGKSYLVDERSKYGTRLNGDELERGIRKQLHNGDIIQIDDCTFSVQTRNL